MAEDLIDQVGVHQGEGSRREDLLSVQEAAIIFGVPAATIRRRIAQGEVSGAFKLKGLRGMEWRLPESALLALGYKKLGRTDAVSQGSARLAEALHRLSESLQAERRRWQEWDRRLGWARSEIARLRSALRREQSVNEGLRRELGVLRGGEIDLREADPSKGSGSPRSE